MEYHPEFQEFIRQCGLTEEDCGTVVSDVHLDNIARSCSASWKFLVAQLKVNGIEIDNIENTQEGIEEKRRKFYRRWKQSKATDATYSQLINAMLNINCKQDALKVCKLLPASLHTHPRQSTSYTSPDTAEELAQQATSPVITVRKRRFPGMFKQKPTT